MQGSTFSLHLHIFFYDIIFLLDSLLLSNHYQEKRLTHEESNFPIRLMR